MTAKEQKIKPSKIIDLVLKDWRLFNENK